MKREDFACQVVGLMREFAEVDADCAAKVESELRRRYAGKQVTVERRAPLTQDDIDFALRRRMSVKDIAQQNGVSRSTIYRMIGSKSLKRRSLETN